MQIDLSRLITAEAKAAAALQEKRQGQSCSRMQGILALSDFPNSGNLWLEVLEYRDRPETTFGEKTVIDNSMTWNRLSQNIAFYAYLLGLDDDQVDTLFNIAAAIEA